MYTFMLRKSINPRSANQLFRRYCDKKDLSNSYVPYTLKEIFTRIDNSLYDLRKSNEETRKSNSDLREKISDLGKKISHTRIFSAIIAACMFGAAVREIFFKPYIVKVQPDAVN